MFTPEEAKEIGTAIGIDWDTVDFDENDLAAGMTVELEHGSKLGEEVNITNDDPEATAKITWAHLMEAADYYDLLAEMETKFGQEDTTEAGIRSAYQITVDPSKKPGTRPQLSPEMEKYVKDYVQEVEQAVKKGTPADDAFKKIMPDLDDLSADDLVNLLWENKQLGGRGSLQKFKDWLPALDIFDLMQKLLERAVWESAVLWWGTQKTQKQQRTKEEQEAAKQRDEESTVVLKKPQSTIGDQPTVPLDDAKTNVKTSAAEFTYRGHRYRELTR